MSNASRKAKRKLPVTSPLKRKAKGGKSSKVDCLLCEESILEAGKLFFVKVAARVGFIENVLAQLALPSTN